MNDDERRVKVFRRPPITIELDSGLELVARPLPWQARNDLGDMIMKDYIQAMNESLQALKKDDDSPPELVGGLADKIKHLDEMFKAAFPDVTDESLLASLTYEQLIACLLAALDVNKLEVLKVLVDPNFHAPVPTSGTPGAPESGLKVISSPDSSSPALPD
jgi:hypothetical protein